jgi:hypothetical protein
MLHRHLKGTDQPAGSASHDASYASHGRRSTTESGEGCHDVLEFKLAREAGQVLDMVRARFVNSDFNTGSATTFE